MENFYYTYVLIFALYMAIILYGQLVATNVAAEKSSRAMELLITSSRTTNLMFGKIIGSGLAGVAQMAVVLGAGYVCFNLNRSYWLDNAVINSIFDMPLGMVLYSLMFFILGFFMYAFMFGALGSLVSRTEDINTAILPVLFLFVGAFMISMMGMSTGNVDTMLMKVSSFVPFSSPMAMFVRITMGEVKPIEIVLSVVLLVLSTIGMGYVSAKIYRLGVLLYGKPPKLSIILKMLRHS
jgi:ABC-2 type transport system permease protein